MTWVNDKDVLQAEARVFDKSVKLKTKNSKLWLVGGKNFKELFATTLGHSIYIPSAWTSEQVRSVLVHECRHIKQFRMFGWLFGMGWWAPAGIPLFLLFYAAVPLPIGLAWIRYRLELDADSVFWKFALKNGVDKEIVHQRSMSFANTVFKYYGWPWPKPWIVWGFNRKFNKMLKSLSK